MKRIKIFLIITSICIISASLQAQTQCVNCSTDPVGSGANIIGINSSADGAGSVAIGTSAHTSSSALNSIAIGTQTKTIAGLSFVIGNGVNADYMLTNYISRSLMVGFYSDVPTLFIGSSNGIGTTGKIGIGNITSPFAKLHILADEGEEAAMFIQPNNWDNNENSTMYLGSLNTYITANKEIGINFHSEGNYMFGNDANVLIKATETETSLQIKEGDIYIEDIDFGIIMKSPNGKCWRGQVDDNGQLNFSELENCPETVTSVNDKIKEEVNQIKVYPNPATNTINIELQEDSKEEKQILLVNTNGSIVYSNTFSGNSTKINTSTLNNGIYVINIRTEGNYISSKVTIQKNK